MAVEKKQTSGQIKPAKPSLQPGTVYCMTEKAPEPVKPAKPSQQPGTPFKKSVDLPNIEKR